MRIKQLLPICALTLISVPALAWTTINVTNNTSEECKMVGESLEEVSGSVVTNQDLSTIPAGGSIQFWLYPGAFYGPDVIATYECGEKIIKFESSQNNGIFMCSIPAATPLEVDASLKMAATTSNGWRLLNPGLFHTGTINWTISSKL